MPPDTRPSRLSEAVDGSHVVRERWELADAAAPAAAATAAAAPSQLRRTLGAAATALFRVGFLAALSVLRPLLVVVLRLLVRSKRFWHSGLANAYFEKVRQASQASLWDRNWSGVLCSPAPLSL